MPLLHLAWWAVEHGDFLLVLLAPTTAGLINGREPRTAADITQRPADG